MTTDYRAMCAELVDALENARRIIDGADGTLHINTAEFVLRRARALLDQPVAEAPTYAEMQNLASHCVKGNKSIEWVIQTALTRWGNSQGILDSSPQPVPPSGYAYRYPDGIRFNGGQNVNGCRPSEVIPYWFSQIPANALPTPEANAQ